MPASRASEGTCPVFIRRPAGRAAPSHAVLWSTYLTFQLHADAGCAVLHCQATPASAAAANRRVGRRRGPVGVGRRVADADSDSSVSLERRQGLGARAE